MCNFNSTYKAIKERDIVKSLACKCVEDINK